MKQQRLLATAPKDVTEDDVAGIFRRSLTCGDPHSPPDDGLLAALRGAGVADVDDSGLARALYSSDASLYRVLPRAVVRPRHADEIVATLEVCRALGVPLTMRGAGTSIAGNAVGPGRRPRHQPAPVAGCSTSTPRPGRRPSSPASCRPRCRRRSQPHGLRFGPDPSTHNRCTVGGMIGNNACGSRALGYGRTSDNVVGLDVVTGGGRAAAAGHRRAAGAVLDDLRGAGRRASSPRSAPSSAASAARCPATRWSTCCPSAASTSPGRWSAARARSPLVLGATVRLVADAPHRGAGRARLPDDGRRRRRDPGPAAALPHRRRGAGRPDRAAAARRAGRRRARPAARRGLADRRAHRRQRRPRSRRRPRRVRGRRRRAGRPGGHRPGAGGGDLADPRGRRRARRPHQRRAARRTPAGRTPPSRPSGWATTCASSRRCWPSTGCRACPTATSATAACTCGSTSRSARAAPTAAAAPTGRSSRTPPGWSPATAARCPASTATAGPAASCCR